MRVNSRRACSLRALHSTACIATVAGYDPGMRLAYLLHGESLCDLDEYVQWCSFKRAKKSGLSLVLVRDVELLNSKTRLKPACDKSRKTSSMVCESIQLGLISPHAARFDLRLMSLAPDKGVKDA